MEPVFARIDSEAKARMLRFGEKYGAHTGSAALRLILLQPQLWAQFYENELQSRKTTETAETKVVGNG